MEKRTSTYYVLSRKLHNMNYGLVATYKCHRSRTFKLKGKEIWHMKLAGTCKIGAMCPKYIQCKTNKETGLVNVVIYQTHIGHDFSVKHLCLSNVEKLDIAGQLLAGVPKYFIRNKIMETASPTKRLAATTCKDIRNIANSYGLTSNVVRHESDVLSVDSWVREMRTQDYNPILIYKLPGDTISKFADLE